MLTSCQSLKDETANNIYNTNTTGFILPIKYMETEQNTNANIFWLYDEIVLIVRDNATGCAYDLFDWNEQNLIESGDLKLKTTIQNTTPQVSFLQLNKNQFFVKNLFDQKESFLWEYKDGEVVIRPVSLGENFVSYGLNTNATCLVGLVENLDSIQVYQIQQKEVLKLVIEKTLSLVDLSLSQSSKLLQVAFINDNEFVYQWSENGKEGYGVYSLKEQLNKHQDVFNYGKILPRKDSVVLARDYSTSNTFEKLSSGFIFINTNGVSDFIANKDGLPLGYMLSSGDYTAFVSETEDVPGKDHIYTWTVMKPLDLESTDVWSIENLNSQHFNLGLGTPGTLAFTKEQVPALVFICPSYTTGRKQGYNPDSYGLYIVTKK